MKETLLAEFDRKYVEHNRIHAVIFELTEICPCRCTHCYLVKNPSHELTLPEIENYLEQFHDEGVFNLTLTGGEPLVRTDFPEILAAARRHQFFITVLTSGVLIDEAKADLLARYDVGSVEVTLLGDNAATHDAIMRRPGAFAQIMRACRLLRERDLNLVIKSSIIQDNYTELAGLAGLADEFGAFFSASVSLAPRVDGDRSVQSLALAAEQLSTLDPALLYGGLIPGEDHQEGGLLTCRAGITVAAVSSQGVAYPCVLFRRPVGDLRQRSLQEIWHDDPDPFLVELRGIEDADVNQCPDCAIRKDCRRCPGVAWLETGKLREPAPSCCTLAEGLANFTTDGVG